jgi:hypothetical protein
MRLRLLLKTTIFSTLLILGSNVGRGQALLVEDFNYTVGTFLSANGWNAHSGAGATPIQVVSPGLTYTDYAGSGIGYAAGLNNTGEDVNRTFPSVSSGTIYAAFIIETSASNSAGYFIHFGQTIISTTFFTRVWVNATGSGVGIGSTTPGAYVPITAGTPTLIAVKLDLATKISSLYVLSSFASAEPGVADQTFTETATYTNVGSIALRQFNAAERVIVDGIRVATTWAEAVKANTPPVASFNPENASTTGNPDENIIITFDEAASNTDGSPITDPTSLITFKETDGSGADVAFTATINAGKTEITIVPSSILDFNKTYYVAVAPVEDVVGMESQLQVVIFTTRVQDVVAPLWTTDYPKVSAIANSDFNLLVNLDEKGKAYYVVLPDGGPVPSAAQVITGQDGASAPALKSGSINVAAAVTEFSTNISGLTAASVYDVYVVAEDVEITPNLQTATADILNVTTTDSKPEPSNQASNLDATVIDQTSVTLTWTDAIGSQLPAGYLILVNETDTFTDPVDGIAQPDGASVANVNHGVGTKTITGLTAGLQYFFKMYSYTNSGTAIDYLLTAPVTQFDSIPKLVFTYPVGGETFYAGDSITIKWQSKYVDGLNIEVSFDNGLVWQPWIGPIWGNDSIAKVVIPSDASYGNTYKLRIIDLYKESINDVTDAAFTVKAVTSSLIDLLTMPANAVVKYVGKATVTYARTTRNQKYIQDSTAAVLIDDPTTSPGFVTGTYAIGDGITNIEGKIVLYGGLVELTPTAPTGEPCTGNPVITPEIRAIESLTHLDQCKLVKIENFSFDPTGEYLNSSAFVASKNYTITGYATTVFAYRTLFSESDYIGTEIPLAPITAVCIVGEYNGAMQITARNSADITSTGAEITSSVYTVDYETSVISDVPEAHSLVTFKDNLIVSAGATFDVFDSDGTTPATVLDNSKLVIATAQDGTTKKTYTIVITIYVPGTVATLSKLSYNDTPVNGFLSGSLNYAVQLPVGTTVVPEVTYILTDAKASAVVTDATNLTGTEAERTSSVLVTAEDGITKKTYTILFTVYVQSSNASLTKISVNGTAIPDFASGTLDYAVLLPVGTAVVPTVTYLLADAKATAALTNATNLFGAEAERTSKVAVTAEDGVTVKTYNIVFTVDNTGFTNARIVKLSIYPVPAIDEINISGLAKVKRLEIMDVTGKILRNVEVTGDKVTLNISDLRKGMYFLRTESQTLKFIKK